MTTTFCLGLLSVLHHATAQTFSTTSMLTSTEDADTAESNASFGDAFTEFPTVSGVCIAMIVLACCCCIITVILKRGEQESATTCFTATARAIIIGSWLAEDILALLWQDTSVAGGERNIFWIFYGFAVSGACLELYTSCFKLASFFMFMGIEIGQAILFMWICDWQLMPVFVLTTFCTAQVLLECACLCAEIGEETDEADEAMEKTQAISAATMKCCMAALVGVGMLPYLYYNEDSPFRTQWFDIFVTCSIWFSTISGEIMMKSALVNPALYQGCLAGTTCVGLATQLVVYVVSIQYVDDALPGFEKGWTIFIIVMGSLAICCFPCSVYYQWKNAKMLEELGGTA